MLSREWIRQHVQENCDFNNMKIVTGGAYGARIAISVSFYNRDRLQRSGKAEWLHRSLLFVEKLFGERSALR